MNEYEELEQRWARWNELDPGGMVACSSGTAALHLALEALKGRSSDPWAWSVAVPDYSMIACPRAVTLAGMVPIFVDCDERLLINAAHLPHTAITMAVHVYGRRCDMDAVHARSTRVVEDMSEIHGTVPHPDTDAACWSFYKNKIVGGEEGGAVYFKDPENAALARSLRSLGFTDEHDFYHIPRGHNYRLSNVHASLILESLDAYTQNLHRRRQCEAVYEKETPESWLMPYREQPWVYDMRIPGLQREKQTYLVNQMRHYGARHGFVPMSLQKEYSACEYHGEKLAHKLHTEIMYLPFSPGHLPLHNAATAIRRLRSLYEHRYEEENWLTGHV